MSSLSPTRRQEERRKRSTNVVCFQVTQSNGRSNNEKEEETTRLNLEEETKQSAAERNAFIRSSCGGSKIKSMKQKIFRASSSPSSSSCHPSISNHPSPFHLGTSSFESLKPPFQSVPTSFVVDHINNDVNDEHTTNEQQQQEEEDENGEDDYQQQQREDTERIDNRTTFSLIVTQQITTAATATTAAAQSQPRLPSHLVSTPRQTTSGTSGTTLTATTSFSSILSSSSSHNGQQQTQQQQYASVAIGTRSVDTAAAIAATIATDTSSNCSSSLHSTNTATTTSNLSIAKRRKINLLIDQCESTRFIPTPFSKNKKRKKKTLLLSNMNLTSNEVPIQDIVNTGTLSTTLYKLSLSGNALIYLPHLLVTSLSGLKLLDVSQCELKSLPEKWDMPKLERLDLGHNKIREFPCEKMLQGLPELKHLDMYGNSIRSILLPTAPPSLSSSSASNGSKLLSKLESLNLGYNALSILPPTLCALTSLRTLKVDNNMIEKIPVQVCEMDLRIIDVSSNPLIQPPAETCERGICSMRRYYSCLRLEGIQHKKMAQQLDIQKNMKKEAPSPAGQCKKIPRFFGSMKRSQTICAASRFNALSSAPTPAIGAAAAAASSGQLNQKEMSRARSLPIQSLSSATPSSLQQQQQQEIPHVMKTSSPSIQSQSNDSSSNLQQPQRGLSQKGEMYKRVTLTPSSLHTPLPRSIQEAEATQALKTDSVLSDPSTLPLSLLSLSSSGMKTNDVLPPQSHFLQMRPPPQVDVNLKRATSSHILLPPLKTVHNESYPSKEPAVEPATPFSLPIPPIEKVSPIFASTSSSSEKITCNNTLKVIFVGMAYSGKTSMIKRLIDGPNAKIPQRDERTVGVDIYEWDPSDSKLDTSIVMEDEIGHVCEETNVNFSVWDFAGQHVYHATHELFFSQRALYVLVWDMGATNNDTQKRIFTTHDENDQGAFKLTYDSSDDENEDVITDDEKRRTDRALERDIDEKVQFWVDFIRSSASGAALLTVASHNDFFEHSEHGSYFSPDEAKRRCDLLKSRLLHHERHRMRGLQKRLDKYEKNNRANADAALRLRKLLCPFSRPKLIFGGGSSSSSAENEEESIVRVSCAKYTGFD
uniref:Roc domain-containing protein n=1 Tax=Ditylum brightwellii TaxID=49249 RepID=A0A7S1ZZC8_9STRA|mmetsp:Transcript_5124/g.7835  ORF Transcript_5124/g.7835 Transcript_5124/m.7835 type:complete len:1102 (+) Transcript_5124:121-3426(+)